MCPPGRSTRLNSSCAKGEKQFSSTSAQPVRTGWLKLDATAYCAVGRALAARRTAGFAISKPASCTGLPACAKAVQCSGRTSPRRSPSIQQVERHICPGGSAVRKTQLPQRPAEDAVIPGVQEGTAGGGPSLCCRPGPWCAYSAPAAGASTSLSPGQSCGSCRISGQCPRSGFAAERALPGGKRLRFHRCDPQWVRWHRRGRSYTLQSW